ncbi:MAG: hypothetical protein IPK79_10680 [Vampirovibrionales bacterium]|nr:hypothetical protein [Vampirovibrionales bacterium]
MIDEKTRLEGIFAHLSACTGLYAKDTFENLLSCMIRMIREHRLQGLAICRTLGDERLEPIIDSLAGRPEMTIYRLDDAFQEADALKLGFVIILTDRHCAAIHWRPDARQSLAMANGGWTFHPQDCRSLALRVAEMAAGRLPDAESLATLIQATPLDRRFDEKWTLVISSLVNGLENRNQALGAALAQVSELNRRMVDQECLAAVGKLCSVIAHEIRNPLGLIDLYAKLIEAQVAQAPLSGTPEEAEALREPLNKNVALIRQSIESLEMILSELSQYARPLTLDLQDVPLVAITREVCEFFRPSYDERGVTLRIQESALEGLNLRLDAGRIRQALVNLLKNALEVSRAGDEVTVNVARRKGDSNVYVKVRDQGAGVEELVRQKLFTPYFSTKKNGTGLGLAHSRKILQSHGGSVELLSSRPGEGSVFALVLPLETPLLNHAHGNPPS